MFDRDREGNNYIEGKYRPDDEDEGDELPLSTKIQERKTELKVKISMMKRNVIEFKREIEKS